MKSIKKQFILVAAVMLLAFTAACSSSDDNNTEKAKGDSDFPSKPISLIVPVSSGGGSDTIARAIAAEAEKSLDESIGIVNKTGGSGSVGMTEGANAKADGYTVSMVFVELTMFDHLGISPLKHTDFKPLGLINLDPAALTVAADAPYDTLEEFIDYAKENPGKVKIGNSGTGSIWHIAAEVIAEEAGIDIVNVPFEGATEAVTGVVGGHVDAVTVSPAEVKAQLDAGNVKTLAIMSDEKSDIIPDVPTFSEAGLDVESVGTWRGFAVPKDTPDDVAKKLEDAFIEAANTESFKTFMENNGFGIDIKSSDEFEQHMDENYEFYGEVLEGLELE